MVFEGRVESGTWLFQPRERSTSWNSSSRQETRLRNFKSAGAIVFPDSIGFEEKEITRSLLKMYAERLVECVCEMSRIFFSPTRP